MKNGTGNKANNHLFRHFILLIFCLIFLCGCASSGTNVQDLTAYQQNFFTCTVEAEENGAVYVYALRHDENGTMWVTTAPQLLSGVRYLFAPDGSVTLAANNLTVPVTPETDGGIGLLQKLLLGKWEEEGAPFSDGNGDTVQVPCQGFTVTCDRKSGTPLSVVHPTVRVSIRDFVFL